MYNIASFLEKFKHVGLKERQAREVVAKIVSEECGITLGIESVQYKNAVATLKIPLSSKSQIYIKKSQILKRCALEFPGMVLKDVR
ncbi:hypothetical protein EPO17_02850 [Patescibacteria group bacterium]|nr:MAG: hypothetical protein EPO17_02850 [Patescibacteria group bacterium]